MKGLNVTVSIIEDDSPARDIFAEWLNHAAGFKCLGNFASAELAIPAVLQQQPDVVLTDINLPGISGIECVRRLKPQLPNTQFVMLTVYEDADHIFEALAAGASGYLLKQTRRNELINALREVNAGGSPMTSNIARKVVQSFQPARSSEAESLSPREAEVLDLLARGYLYKEIAESIGVSLPTVNTYIRRIYEKLHVRSRGQAVARYAHLSQRGASVTKAAP
jgi:DNA-binding NarL/FixJ family response regulator